ncbi:methionine aminopeptidase, type I [Saprolegnia diclina VS20]|uniref:Methionine aminopeptidase n=1 Tax=Saprolegnia diclina (strain VS20) TaxID=1156394 RepID=T0QD31_SAPDV|nr:methionine aminopeptidase, type I [Saprolegnia diclina VS20]EQC31445.1 methionine aminopeptidase, type I [Saprolegnia diclina VS20]|eukprot:XP_008615286.1 methionine aminopeptidase, type I [Saprolegnia diclina VS20]
MFRQLQRHARAFATRAAVEKGLVSPVRSIPAHIQRPPYAASGEMPPFTRYIPILDKDQQLRLHDACALAKDILAYAGSLVEVGQTTEEIDRQVHDEVIRRNAYPSPMNYGHFPKSICTSVNEVVVHGIPDSRALLDGDIVNLDISVYLNGFHGDTSATFLVGNVDDAGKKLVATTQQALLEAIELCKPGVPFSAIGAHIHNLSKAEGFSVVHEFCGHGIGQQFHTLPFILHYPNTERGEMLPGMAFTIEPALCEGSNEIVYWDDDWTVSTADEGRSVQFEHTILITDSGADILT